jgi:peptide chain release factor 1
LTVFCADERSQLKNKAKALKILRSRLLKQRQEEEAAKYAAHRRSQVGTGDRSERIRTYNYPQSRVTDHRINYTSYNLTHVLEGALEDFVLELQKADQAEKVQFLLEDSEPQI